MDSPRCHAMAAKATAPKPATPSQTRIRAIFMVGYSACKNKKTTTTKQKDVCVSSCPLWLKPSPSRNSSNHRVFTWNMRTGNCKIWVAIILFGAIGLSGARAQAPEEADSLPAVSALPTAPWWKYVTDTTATIAWSTNVNSGTTLHYGTEPNHLDQGAACLGAALPTACTSRTCTPGTKYFFQAESSKAQATGTSAMADVKSFETRPSGYATARSAWRTTGYTERL